jgi:uncharacterized membrane protein (UPF0127 family)
MGTNAKRFGRSIKQIVAIILIVVLCAGAIQAYGWWATRPELMRGSFEVKNGARAVFDFEIRNTCQGRQEGLMFRRLEDFPANRGMLFLFPRSEIQRFWMRNTLLALDMIFLDRNFNVVGILSDVPPLNEISRAIEEPSQYVVELRAGIAAQSGIVAGSKLKLEGELPRVEDC